MYQEEQNNEQQQFHLPPLPTIDFKIQPQVQINCQNLIIAFYGVASLFIESAMTKSKSKALINFQKSKQKSLATIYYDGEGNHAYLIFNQEFEAMRQIHLAQFISKVFKFKESLIFISITKNILNTHTNPSLKYLKTQFWKQRCLGSKFEEGLRGPYADILGWGQSEQLPIACYVAITGEYQVNKQVIDEVFGVIRGKYGLNGDNDISQLIRKYNMQKYSNKIYL